MLAGDDGSCNSACPEDANPIPCRLVGWSDRLALDKEVFTLLFPRWGGAGDCPVSELALPKGRAGGCAECHENAATTHVHERAAPGAARCCRRARDSGPGVRLEERGGPGQPAGREARLSSLPCLLACLTEMAACAPEPDAELEELLESALGDFDRAQPALVLPATTAPEGESGSSGNSNKGSGDAAKDCLFASQDKFFQELFEGELASQATAEFEKAMKELAEEEPHLVEQFQKLSEAAGRVGSDATSQQEFTSCLNETLSGLAKNANDLQSSGVSEEELTQTMEGLGLEEGDREGSLWPVMQNIMQNLLSKDVLYPSLKEITEKYPEWLQSHQDSLPKEQYEKYQEQHLIMGKICQQFESELPTDGEAEHRVRFEAILDLMQQLQDLGHPPKELAGEPPPGLNFDLEGLSLPDARGPGGEQCQIM